MAFDRISGTEDYMTTPLDFNVPSTREALLALTWEYKKLIPRGQPYPKVVTDAEDTLWGWRFPRQPTER